MKQRTLSNVSVISVVATFAFLCGCQQIPSIADQQDDLADFSQISLEDKNETIEEWHDMISIDKIKESDSHCCYIRFQHALKNLCFFVKEANYKKNNKIRYDRIVEEYLAIAKKSADLTFMTNCIEGQGSIADEIINIRKTAISSIITLNDEENFYRFMEIYSASDYEYPIQTIIAKGLIKYLPNFKSDNTCAKIILKSMLLKQRQENYAEMKEVEHLVGMCINLSSLNEAIRMASNDTSILELVLDLNLNYWRKIQKDNLDFSERSAWENIALLKKLALSAASKKIESLIFFTLCEIVPAESLVVLNSKMEAEPSFANMKNMLSFYCSLQKMNTSSNARFNKLTNIDQAIQTCKKLAKEFIKQKLVTLQIAEQKESYELYAKNLPDQVYEYLCQKFFEGKEKLSFYENAINTTIWLMSQKIYSPEKTADLGKAVDKLLYSCRSRDDYKAIFELVHANRNSYVNQWHEMKNAAAKSDVKQKAAFIDCFVTLLSKMYAEKSKKLPDKFKTDNYDVFEYIFISQDASAMLKIIPFLEKQGEYKFLLEKYFSHTFINHKHHSSVAHMAVAGDIASKHLSKLKEDKKLYDAYKKLFIKGIANKNNDLSLLCADYYFRIIDQRDKSGVELGKKEFITRWPNLREIPAPKKK